MSRRRSLFALATAACLSAFYPSLAHAQQPASPPRIGVLLAASLYEEEMAQAFRQGVLDAGYSERRDVVIEWRSANGDCARIAAPIGGVGCGIASPLI